MIILSAEVLLQPEKMNEFLEIADKLAEESRKESGCIRYDYYTSPYSSNTVLFFELWKSLEDLDAHDRTPHFKMFLEKGGACMGGKPDVKVFSGDEIER